MPHRHCSLAEKSISKSRGVARHRAQCEVANVLQFPRDEREWKMEIDARMNAFRHDAADVRLREAVPRDKYFEGKRAQIAVAHADVHKEPSRLSEMTTQYLYGESIFVFEMDEGWAWCQSAVDSYVGYITDNSFTFVLIEKSHHVILPLVHCYSGPDPRTSPLMALPLNATILVAERRSAMMPTGPVTLAHADNSFWIPEQGFSDKLQPQSAAIEIAKGFLNVPYLWGGKTFFGIDCSGLVQVVLNACGVSCPRDADQQQSIVGEQIYAYENARAGDLIYLPDHVGFYIGSDKVLHADGVSQLVCIEGIESVLDNRHLSKNEMCIRRFIV